jgi:hypothetical protein
VTLTYGGLAVPRQRARPSEVRPGRQLFVRKQIIERTERRIEVASEDVPPVVESRKLYGEVGIRCALNRTQFAKDLLVGQFAQPLLLRSYGSNSQNLATDALRPLVNSGAKHFEDVMSFLPGCPLSA